MIADGSRLKETLTTSVFKAPVAEAERAVQQEAEGIGSVYMARAPEAIITGKPPGEEAVTASAVATPEPRPETPVEIGRPVALVNTPEVGVPKSGVTKVGEVAKTREPVPVSSITAVIRLGEVGEARKVATPVPRPLMPEVTGRPVPLVRMIAVGVVRFGVSMIGE